MSNYDSLDELIEMVHALKVDFDHKELRDHIIDVAWNKAKTENPEDLAIKYIAEIHKKALIQYAIYDQPMKLHYQDGGIRLTRK